MNYFLVFCVLALQILCGYVVEKSVIEANVIRQTEINNDIVNNTKSDRKSYPVDLKHQYSKNGKKFSNKHSTTESERKENSKMEHHHITHPSSKHKNHQNKKHVQLKSAATSNTSGISHHTKPLKNMKQKNDSIKNNKLGSTKFRKRLGEILKFKELRSNHSSKTSGKFPNNITFPQNKNVKPVKRTKQKGTSKSPLHHKVLRQYPKHPKSTTSEIYPKNKKLSSKLTPLTTKNISSTLSTVRLSTPIPNTSNIFSRETSTNTSISQSETYATDLSEVELQSLTATTSLSTQTQISEIEDNVTEKTVNIESRDDLESDYIIPTTARSIDLDTLNKIPIKRNVSGTIRDIHSKSIDNSSTDLETSIQNSVFISKSENIIKSSLIKSDNTKTTVESEIDFQQSSSTADTTVSTFVLDFEKSSGIEDTTMSTSVNNNANSENSLTAENSNTHHETGTRYMPEYGFVDTKAQNLLLSKSTDAKRNVKNEMTNQNASSYETKTTSAQDDLLMALENDITNTNFDDNWENETVYEFDDSSTVTDQTVESVSHTSFKNSFSERAVRNKSEMLNNLATENIFKKFVRQINEIPEIPISSEHNVTTKIIPIEEEITTELKGNLEVITDVNDLKIPFSLENFISPKTLGSKRKSINLSSAYNLITETPLNPSEESKTPVRENGIVKIPIDNEIETITFFSKDVREAYPNTNITNENGFTTETQNNTVVKSSSAYTDIAEIKDDDKEKRFINVEYGTINETKSKIEQQIVEIFEENNTASNFKNIYINVSKTDIRIIVPVFENRSFSLDAIEQQLRKLGILKGVSFLKETGKKNFFQNPFFGWIVLCFTRHALQTALAICLIIFIVLLVILIRCHSKRKITLQEMHKKELRHESYSSSSVSDELEDESESSSRKKQKSPVRIVYRNRDPKQDKTKSSQRKIKDKNFEKEESSSSSSGDSDTKPAEIRKDFSEEDIPLPDINRNKMKSPQKKSKDKNFERGESLSSSSGDYDAEPIEIRKNLSEEDIPFRDIDRNKTKSPQKKSKDKNFKRGKSLSSSSGDSDAEPIEIRNNLSEEDIRLPGIEDRVVNRKKLGVKSSLKETQARQPEKRGIQKKKKQLSKLKKLSSEDSVEIGDKPHVQKGGRINQWVGRFFKTTRPETPDDDEEKGDKVKPVSPSRKSPEEIDETFTFNRPKFFSFLSPSRRKKKDIFGKRHKHLTPSLETIVSGSDLSWDPPFPSVDSSALQKRVITGDDSEKIDHALIRNDWEKSFFTANEIRPIERENLQLHQPVERKKMNLSKIESNRAESLGTISKASSDQSLRDVIGKEMITMPKARVASNPKAATVYELKTHIK